MASDESRMMKEGWNERARRDAFFFVETHPDLWSGDVEAFFAVGEERTQLLVDPVLERGGIDPSETVALEVGCGLGRFSRALAGRFERVVGVDVAEEMVARARELNPPSEYPNLSFVVSDGVSLPVEPDSIGFVFSYEVFQHMPSRRVVEANLREIARVLRPGGGALLHFRHSEQLLLRWGAGRWTYDFCRQIKHTVLRDDALTSNRTFRGTPALSLSAITAACASASLDVGEWFRDPTNNSHVFVWATR